MGVDHVDGVDIRVGIPVARINQLMGVLELDRSDADQCDLVLFQRRRHAAVARAELDAVLWSFSRRGDRGGVVLRARLRDRTQIPLLRTALNGIADHTVNVVEEWCGSRHRLVATLTAHPATIPTETGTHPASGRPTDVQQEILRRHCGWPKDPTANVIQIPVRERVWHVRQGFVEFTARHWTCEPATGSGLPPYRGFELSRLAGTDEAAFIVPALSTFLQQNGLESQPSLEPLEFSVQADPTERSRNDRDRDS